MNLAQFWARRMRRLLPAAFVVLLVTGPLAIWSAGLAVVPINAKLHPREVEFILGDAGAAVLFVSDDLAADLQPLLGGLPALRRAFTPGDPAYETALAAPSAVRPTTWPGCSTPRAPPAGPRA